jgi:peptidoglycan/xylan/chitin deacetylase (PgdA/CDA1 family)
VEGDSRLIGLDRSTRRAEETTVKRNLLNAFYKVGGFRPFHWGVRDQLLILMYHRFSASSHVSRVSADQFRQHLRYLRQHANPISLHDGLTSLTTGASLPPNPVVITIDDGYRDAYDIALPVLREFSFNATLFAVTDFVDGRCWIWTDIMRYILHQPGKGERRTIPTSAGEFHVGGDDIYLDADAINGRLKKMSDQVKNKVIQEIADGVDVEVPPLPTPDFDGLNWDQMREMDATSIQIESHTVTHPILTEADEARVDDELVRSKARLEEMLDRNVNYFCYPNGDVNAGVRDAVARAGYKAALTTNFGFNKSPVDPFMVDRIYAPSSLDDFAQCASGFESLKQMVRRRVQL